MTDDLQPDPRSTDLYVRLGVRSDASTDTIKKAFRRAARQFHPDHATNTQASDAFQRLCEARDVLRDPQTRRAYDARWGPSGGGRAASAPRSSAPETSAPSETAPPPDAASDEAVPVEAEPDWFPWLLRARTAAIVLGLAGNGLFVQAWWHAQDPSGRADGSAIPYAVVLPLEVLYVGLPAILHLLVLSIRLRLWDD